MAKKRTLEPSALRSHLGYRMRVVSNAVSHAFARKLAVHEVTVAEWVILREMTSGGRTMSQKAIADLTGLTRGAVSKLVDRLLRKGLVTRTESDGDRRYQDIELTPAARRLVPKLAALADENDESFFAVLAKGERKTLMDLLTRLAEIHRLNAAPIE